MSEDEGRLTELQSALRSKMADNKAIADSFSIEDGVVQVTTQQKSAFDKNMSDIKEIKSLIEGLESMRQVEQWGSAPISDSVAATAASAGFHIPRGAKSLGELFIDSAEFKSLNNGKNDETCPARSS